MNKLFTLKNRAQKAAALVVVFVFAVAFGASAQQSEKATAKSDQPAPGALVPVKKAELRSSNTTPRTIDNGYFTYSITGNSKEDAANFRAARDNFKKSNPEKYAAWEKENKTEYVNGKYIITQAQFDRMPAAKQDYVKANPDKYEIRTSSSK